MGDSDSIQQVRIEHGRYECVIDIQSSPFAVLQEVPRFDSTIVYIMASQLPQYFLSHSSVSVAVETYRTFLSTAGRFPYSPFPTSCYMNLLQRYADLLVHVLHNSPCYPPVTVSMDSEKSVSNEISSEQPQIPETALEEALLLLLILRDELSEIGSVNKVLEISKLAYEAYSEANLLKEGVEVSEE